MRTILVPLGGGVSDEAVLAMALAVARPLSAHLELLHVHQRADQAAINVPHIGFATGEALRSALGGLTTSADHRAAHAEEHARAFCARHGIELLDAPRKSSGVTARWRREDGDALSRLLMHARHNDLVVVARARRPDGLPDDRIERLLMTTGRPLLIAPDAARPPARIGTLAICWNEAPDAARALSAAVPLLARAERAVVITVSERAPVDRAALDDLVGQLAWHGIVAEARVEPRGGRPMAEVLLAAARAAKTDLMVMGGYGRARVREILFGGCTQSIIEGADVPVMLLR